MSVAFHLTTKYPRVALKYIRLNYRDNYYNDLDLSTVPTASHPSSMLIYLKQLMDKLNLGHWFNRENSPSYKQKNTAGDNIGRDKNIYITDLARSKAYDLQFLIYNACKDFNVDFFRDGRPTRETYNKFCLGTNDAGVALNETDYKWLKEIKEKSIKYIHKHELLSKSAYLAGSAHKLAGELEHLEAWLSKELSKEKINSVFKKT